MLVTAFSARSLKANTSSEVLLPSLYAACVFGIICSLTLSFIRRIVHIARIFLRIDNNIIGLRFSGGPFFFPGFCSGTRCPNFISFGYFPVFTMLFNSSAICWWTVIGAYLRCSALSRSHPALLLFFSEFTAVCISSDVKGWLSSWYSISGSPIAFSFWKTLLKWSLIAFIFPFVFPMRFPSLSCTVTLLLLVLYIVLTAWYIRRLSFLLLFISSIIALNLLDCSFSWIFFIEWRVLFRAIFSCFRFSLSFSFSILILKFFWWSDKMSICLLWVIPGLFPFGLRLSLVLIHNSHMDCQWVWFDSFLMLSILLSNSNSYLFLVFKSRRWSILTSLFFSCFFFHRL